VLNERLQGKTVLVTGASSGLGRAIASYAANDARRLILIARNKEKLDQLKEVLEEQFATEGIVFPFDLRRYHELPARFAEVLPGITVDVLVNTAGVGKFKTVQDLTFAEIEAMMKINFLGLVALTKIVLPSMLKQSSGHIINIASQGGKIVTPKASVYGASKKAILGFSDGLRLELRGTGVYVTTVNPGPMTTDFFTYADETGRYLQNVGPWVLDTEKVAKKIVQFMLTDVRELNMPRVMNWAAKLYALAPGFVEWIGKPAFYRK